MRWHYLAASFILVFIVLLNLHGHLETGMPLHIDSWMMTVEADDILKQHAIHSDEPFSGQPQSGPIGNSVFQTVLSSITGAKIISFAIFLPAILNAIMALLFYTLSKFLFKNKIAALSIMAFQPLVLSQITMLGPFYLVNLSFAMVLTLLYFYFFMRAKLWEAGLCFAAIAVIHTSTMVFVLLTTALFFVFNRKAWKMLPFMAGVGVIAVLAFITIHGSDTLMSIASEVGMFDKAWPYFQYMNLLGFGFAILLAIGFYLIFVYEKKATSLLVPIFGFMAVDMFLYWVWRGFLLVYRRLITYIFLLTPFFVGYAVYRLTKKYNQRVILFLALIILMPFAAVQNIRAREPYVVYLTKEESELFTEFGKAMPGAYLLTDHLQSYALPYYNLKPISLSPAHGANTTYYSQVGGCYLAGDLDCIGKFFNSTGFELLYTNTILHSTFMQPFYEFDNKTIYKFNQKIYNSVAHSQTP